MRQRFPHRSTRARPRRSWIAVGPLTVLLSLVGDAAVPVAILAGPPADRLAVAQASGAPAARPITLRGTIIALERDQLRVATASGPQVVRLTSPLTVTGATQACLADITPGTFLGTAARAQPDGPFRALGVHICPESMRGTGEGHRPMEAPGTTMTNASVEALVQRADGPLLTL